MSYLLEESRGGEILGGCVPAPFMLPPVSDLSGDE